MPIIPTGPNSLGNLQVILSANSTHLVRGMRQAEMQVASSSAKMAAQAKVLAGGVTAALTAIGAVSVIQFAKFDKALTQSLAIMTDVNEGIRREMSMTARQLATETTTSAEKLAEAYFFLASAGLSAEQSINALSTVNTFAIAGQFDMARATDLLTDAQSALGLTVSDTAQNMENMNRISDVLVKANTLANATVEQFSTSLTREAGAALKTFNIQVEEGVAVLAAFADQGVKGELAGTGLSRILRLMTTAAVKNEDAYKRMNVKVFDEQTGNIRELASIIGDLEVAFADMSDKQRVAALDALGFQARVQGVILPLIGTSDKIREYNRELENAGGTTAEVARKQMQTFINQLKITWNRINEIFLIIGQQLTPTLVALNEMFAGVVGTSDELNDRFNGFQSAGFAFVSVVGAIGDAIWGLRMAYYGLAAAVQAQMGIVLKAMSFAAVMSEKAINRMIKAFNSLPGIVDIPLLKVTDGITNFADALLEESQESFKKMEDLAKQESFSDRLIKGWEKASKRVEEENKKIRKSMEDTAAVGSGRQSARQTAEIMAASNDIEEMFTRTFGEGGVAGPLSAPQAGDSVSFEMQRILEQKKLAEEELSILKEIQDKGLELTDEVEKKKLELIKAYTEQHRQLLAAQVTMILNSGTEMFDSLGQIAKTFAGEQSGVYKAMFVASKAFAIADSTVKIAQGIAAAAALPFPANIPAMAQVAAATASIISSIQSVQLTFGGEREMGGPVSSGSAYLVGEAGPELFTPGSSGSIIPNDALGSNVKVIINNYTDARATVTETSNGQEKQIEVMIKRVKNELAAEVNEGRGALNKSMQSRYGLKRRGN